MSKQIISLNTIPNTIFFVVLIVGIGAVFGMWAYEIFETDKKLPFIDKTCTDDTNISDKSAYYENEFIQVDFPHKNTIIKNPVSVSGKANVFEANVRVRIKDESENILTDDFIMASGWMDKLYPFEKKINYKTPQTKNGLIEVFEESAKNGSEMNKIIIPVIFED
ncbi:MAG: Gmad2 immunoglobulin-like domain-containing protein [Candidatus Pacebacteria bacterium]|nr:Gmad2 immunoglobulin-like domain-containing protein [Candidatus Paceibacterota bacterium]